MIKELNEAAIATMETPAIQARLKGIGAIVIAPERQSPQYFQAFVESEIPHGRRQSKLPT